MRTLAPDDTHQVWVGEEHKAGAAVDHLVYGGLLDVRHVAQNREHQHAGNQARQGVHDAGDDCVPIAILVMLVIFKLMFTCSSCGGTYCKSPELAKRPCPHCRQRRSAWLRQSRSGP